MGNSNGHIFKDMEKDRNNVEEEMKQPFGNELLDIGVQIEELKEKMSKLLQKRYEIEKQNGTTRVELYNDYRYSRRSNDISEVYKAHEMQRPYGKEIWDIEGKIEDLKTKSKNLLERRKEVEEQKRKENEEKKRAIN